MSTHTDRTAVVTGATGFLGHALVEALVTAGWRVRATGRRTTPDELPGGVAYRAADLTVDQGLDELLDGATHLFHLAGASSSRSSQEEMLHVNVTGTRNLMGAALRAQLERVVHVSTTAVYGEAEPLPQPVREDVEPQPTRGYGMAKLLAEREVWEAAARGLPAVAMRPVTVYGPRNTKLLASTILDTAIERRGGRTVLEIDAEPLELRLLHVDDFLRACMHLAVADVPLGRAYNLASGVYPTSHEVASVIAEAFGMTLAPVVEREPGPSYEERVLTHKAMLADGMTADILLSQERLRFLRKANRNNRVSLDALLATGYRPTVVELESSVSATIDWYRTHRWIV